MLIPQKFAGRLIFWTVLVVGSVYLVVVGTTNSRSRQMAMDAAESATERAADLVAARLEGVIADVEARTRFLADVVEYALSESDLEAILQSFVRGDERTWGATIAFAPAWPSKASRKVLYLHRAARGSDRLISADLDSSVYHYWEQPWFTSALGKKGLIWSEPYHDPRSGDLAVVTCSVAFERSGSGERGVVAADLRLAWLDGLLREVQVSPGGFAVLLTRDGRVIAHSIDGGENASREVLVRPDDEARRRLAPVVEAMLVGPEGFQRVRIEGEPEWLSFRRIAHVGWWLAELYPESEMLAGVARLRSSQVGFSLMGLILLAAAVALVSRRLTRGLVSLASSADRIAAGDLETEVPTLSSHDEIGVLTRAFAGMRRALLAYLEDLRIATVAKERLEGELRTARRIQEDMLSSQWAGGTDQGFEISAVLQPARQVGGDLYYHLQEGRRLFFLVGDVSGKGIAAALFMARAKTVFETIAPREEDPGSILTAVNAALCRGNEVGMFVTAACGWLDLRTGGLTVALAGHERPIVVRGDGAVAPLDVDGGPVLGLMEDSRFPVGQGLLAAGDAVVTFTDGISDAQSEEGEFFGTDRLIAALGAARQSDALGITSAALAAVKEFSTGAPQFDDMTVMAVRFLAPLS